MPQLDKVHFFSQYFWLCVFYLHLYFLISKYFLPRMARILQFRKNKFTTLLGHSNEELKLVQESVETAFENIFFTCHKFWSHNSQRTEQWYENMVYLINKNHLKQCNLLYLRKLGHYSLSQNAALVGIEVTKASPCYSSLLAHKLKSQLTSDYKFSGLGDEQPKEAKENTRKSSTHSKTLVDHTKNSQDQKRGRKTKK